MTIVATSPSADATVDVTTQQQQQLERLVASATAKYAVKNYAEASDLYSEATELQASINGEVCDDNAELLFLYGRSLYQVGVSKSDVLGATASTEPDASGAKRSRDVGTGRGNDKAAAADSNGASLAEGAIAAAVDEKTQDTADSKKPFFQFKGDDAYDDSDDDDGNADGAEDGAEAEPDAEEDEEQDEDDLKAAWDVLDLARLHFDRKLEGLRQTDGKGKSVASAAAGHESPETRHVLERLADTHDLLAEISLEGEKFPEAAADFRASLELKSHLYPTESSFIAEAHYKLSLALEFGALTVPADADADADGKAGSTTDAQFDQTGRDEAAQQMELAIESARLRVSKEEARLAADRQQRRGDDDSDPRWRAEMIATEEGVADVKEMIIDMEQRLADLRAPPVSIEAATSGPMGGTAANGVNSALSGILGSILGESAAEQHSRLEQASKEAKDVTGLVRRKKTGASSAGEAAPSSRLENGAAAAAAAADDVNSLHLGSASNGGKRKADFSQIDNSHDHNRGDGGDIVGKKARVEKEENAGKP
ncbi:MAG: hypothetical protein M1825_003895 [Sarcosagium campestre]|nr:MAG: hypothetical protein M1825_003895 [Sarcosagium campestre]